jgi:2-methylisocitrate lyase-like PEP mutase family enzyme
MARGIRKVREVIGDKPLLFNQIASGKSPRLSLTELQDLGVNVAMYATPCLFAAQTTLDRATAASAATDELALVRRVPHRPDQHQHPPTAPLSTRTPTVRHVRLPHGVIHHRRPVLIVRPSNGW